MLVAAYTVCSIDMRIQRCVLLATFIVLEVLSLSFATDTENDSGGIANAISRDAPPGNEAADENPGEDTFSKSGDDNLLQNDEKATGETQGAKSISREIPPDDPLQTTSHAAAEREKAMEARQVREAMEHSIRGLQAKGKELDDEHTSMQGVYDDIVRQKELALIRKQATHDARDLASEMLHDSESRLAGVQRELPMFRQTVNNLSMQALLKSQDINNLEREQNKLRHQKSRLVNLFIDRGLGHWAETVLRRQVKPELSEAILEGSKYVANPVMEGLERATDLESRLAEEIRAHIPGKSSAFYSGLITAFVTLLPAIVIVSICLRVKRSLSQLSLRHIALLGCMYFAMLSALCLAASLITKIDVLVHIQLNSQPIYDFTILIHGFVYAFFTTTHIATSVADGKAKSFTLSVAIITVGVHFFSHSTAHLRRGELPHVDAAAYIVYTTVYIAAAHSIVAAAYQRRKTLSEMTQAAKRAVRLGHGRSAVTLFSSLNNASDDRADNIPARPVSSAETKAIESV